MDQSRYRSLEETFSNQSTHDFSLKRKWGRLSSEKSSSSDDSYDGPIVYVGEFRAWTFAENQRLVNTLPIRPDPKLERWIECQHEAARIVREADLDYDLVVLELYKFADGNVSTPTIDVNVKSKDKQQEWRPTIVTICNMLYVRDCLELAVVIGRPDPALYSHPYSVGPSHPLVNIWETKLRLPVLEVLQHSPWETLNVVRYGTSAAADPKIVVTTNTEVDDRWAGIRQRIEQVCASNGVSDLKALVIPGKVQRRGSLDPLQGILFRPEGGVYRSEVPMGHSIGIEPKGSGTLGGYIVLTDPKTNSRKTMALTNYHVVRPSINDWDAAIDNGEDLLWPKEYANVSSPSAEDQQAEIEVLQQHIAVTEQECKEKAHIEAKVEAGLANEFQKDQWLRVSTRKTALAERLALCQALKSEQLHFGRIFKASGFRMTANKHCLDWALLDPVSARVGRNEFPASVLVQRGIELRGTRVRYLADKPLYFANYPLVEELVFKIGRSTGFTLGAYNGIHPDVNVPLPPNSEHDAERPRPPEDHYCSRSRLVVLDSQKQQSFAVGGDSGSWVFNSRGELAGMLWGSHEEKAFTYFTPMELIVADIEEKTGMKVTLE